MSVDKRFYQYVYANPEIDFAKLINYREENANSDKNLTFNCRIWQVFLILHQSSKWECIEDEMRKLEKMRFIALMIDDWTYADKISPQEAFEKLVVKDD